MAYKALYRTYRPKTFEEIAGQEHIVRTLTNALKTNKIAHAYLFSGPRGTGKTTMARLFAKALNCLEGVGHQCNHCSNCNEIDEGIHPDVVEIDAASNNGIDQVRDLIEKVNYSPIEGRYKVYIIDEVHNMSDNAFNALLKTLEEPPEHVVFILATTEPYNILPTIISRCQRYDFSKVSDENIYRKLVEILEKENVQYDDEAVKAIVSLADGGLRDALSMLDQILAYSNKTLIEEDVYMLFGLASKEEKIDFLKAIQKHDTVLTISKIENFSLLGVDFKRLIGDLLEILKDILIYKNAKSPEYLTILNSDEAQELSDLFSKNNINYLISEFLKEQAQFRFVNNLKTFFELIALRLCNQEDHIQNNVPSNSEEIGKSSIKLQKIKEENIQKENIKQEPPQIIVEERKEEIKEEGLQAPIKEENIVTPPSWLFDDNEETTIIDNLTEEKNVLSDEDIITIMVHASKDERMKLENEWKKLSLLVADPKIGRAAALLNDGHPFILSKDALVLIYDFPKLADKVNLVSNQKSLNSILKKMLGHSLGVYAISRSESIRLRKVFFNLRQINQLPDINKTKFDKNKLKG